MTSLIRWSSGRLIAALFVLMLIAGPAMAMVELNVDDDGLAIKGYDVVAYFTQGEAVEGSRFNQVSYRGARYRFVSKQNAAAFRGDPQKYLPQFGGYCSYGVAVGCKFDVDPEAWKIVDGALFLQLDLSTQLIWNLDRKRYIGIANRVWPSIKLVPPEELEN